MKNEVKISRLQTKINDLSWMISQLKKCEFKSNEKFIEASFGHLSLKNVNKYLVGACDEKTLKMWDLDSFECIKTPTGHTSDFLCMENLSNNQLISGSSDIYKKYGIRKLVV